METNKDEVAVDVGGLTQYGAGMIVIGWQDDKEMYVKVSDVQRLLANKAAAADPSNERGAELPMVSDDGDPVADLGHFINGSIREFPDFREDVERLSAPGLAKKQAKIIRKEIYDTIDQRVRNAVKATRAAHPKDLNCKWPTCQPEHAQQAIADQTYRELYSGTAHSAEAAPEQAVPEAVRVTLANIAEWMNNSAQIVQNGPDDYGPATQFDYELGQAAAEIRALLAAPVPPVPAPAEQPGERDRSKTKMFYDLSCEAQRLHDALCFWLPKVPADDGPIRDRVVNDAYLLVGYDDMPDKQTAEELGWITLNAPAPQSSTSVPRVDGDGEAKTWPERIWLQHQFEYVPAFEVATKACSEITWCQNNVDRYDIEYVRSDLAHVARQDQAGPSVAYSDEARKKFEAWAEMRGYGMERTTDSYKSQGTKSAWRGWNGAVRAFAAQAAPAEQRDAWPDEEALRDAVAEGLRGLYSCGRGWSAWSLGTMTEDDFHPAEESDECIGQVMDAIRALRSTSADSEKGGAA